MMQQFRGFVGLVGAPHQRRGGDEGKAHAVCRVLIQLENVGVDVFHDRVVLFGRREVLADR